MGIAIPRKTVFLLRRGPDPVSLDTHVLSEVAYTLSTFIQHTIAEWKIKTNHNMKNGNE